MYVQWLDIVLKRYQLIKMNLDEQAYVGQKLKPINTSWALDNLIRHLDRYWITLVYELFNVQNFRI